MLGTWLRNYGRNCRFHLGRPKKPWFPCPVGWDAAALTSPDLTASDWEYYQAPSFSALPWTSSPHLPRLAQCQPGVFLLKYFRHLHDANTGLLPPVRGLETHLCPLKPKTQAANPTQLCFGPRTTEATSLLVMKSFLLSPLLSRQIRINWKKFLLHLSVTPYSAGMPMLSSCAVMVQTVAQGWSGNGLLAWCRQRMGWQGLASMCSWTFRTEFCGHTGPSQKSLSPALDPLSPFWCF